jgi:aldehyde:ferredoxin oxidoreductase
MKGFEGNIARIHLSTGKIQTEVIPPDMVGDFIGGSGLTARLLYDLLDENTDPLGPDNPLLFMTGPMVGTSMPSAGRCTVSARSPLTGYWGESNTGGFIGPELRFAGYDGLLITGQAESPVWVSIMEGAVQIHDASDLWGVETYETQQRIRDLLGEPKARIACIGSAGENLVKMAAVVNDHGRAAGRTGMGAVMGSKRLKAVALRGSAEPPVADPEAYQQIVRDIYQELKDDLSVEALRMAGTAGYVDLGLMYGDMPIRYYQRGEWEEGANLSGVLMAEEYQNRNTACYRCPIVCGRETRSPKYGLEEVDGPEYETVGAFGSLAEVDDLEGVIYAGHLCNLYGLDTISTGCTIALACEMFARGVLSEEDTDGMHLEYGDVESTHTLIDMIASREGFGDQLAEGSDALAAAYGVEDLAVTVKGLEVPMHDPRAFSGMAPVYALSPRGACHMQGDMYGVDSGQGPPVELGVIPGDRFEDSEEKGRIVARQQAWRSLYNAFTICQFMNPDPELLCQALNAVMGWDMSTEDLLTAGKRLFTLKRMLNHKLGATRTDDDLPQLLKEPLKEGGTLGNVPDLEPMLEGAYAEHGWDLETGRPTRAALERFGLDFTLDG